MAQGTFLDIIFYPVCIIGVIIIFIACGIIIFLRRNRKSDWLKIASGIIMGICFLVFLFLLWCVIGFGSNAPDTEPKPSGYYYTWNETTESFSASIKANGLLS